MLKTQEKFYLSDVSFKYSQLGFNTNMVASVLENIVYSKYVVTLDDFAAGNVDGIKIVHLKDFLLAMMW